MPEPLMTDAVSLSFDALPSVVRSYPKLLLDRSPPLLGEGRSLPPIEACIETITADPRTVSDYAAVCGFSTELDALPITYPHVLAMPLHMAMLSHSAFGVRLMGLVHLRNRITQFRPVELQEVIALRCDLSGPVETDRGQEFDLRTTVKAADQIVWEESSVFLARRKQPGARRPEAGREPLSGAGVRTTSFQVPADMGRRYAKVSGDINPIHLSGVTARMFGFPRAIAHGMWSMARVVAELQDSYGAVSAGVLEVDFKTPMLLPSWVQLSSVDDGGDLRFELRDSAGERPHLIGRLGAPSEGA
jgi:acyl dehydratase